MRREQMDSARLGIFTYFGPSRLYARSSNSVLGALLAGGVDLFDCSF
jgi:hypothetical protein